MNDFFTADTAGINQCSILRTSESGFLHRTAFQKCWVQICRGFICNVAHNTGGSFLGKAMHTQIIPNFFSIGISDLIIRCKTADGKNGVTIYLPGIDNALIFIKGFYDFSISVIESNVSIVADNITSFCISKAFYLFAQ